MGQSKSGASMNSPPYFDGNNYSHWNTWMMFFLKMQRVWDLVEYGWGPPLILDAQGRSTEELKPKHKWDKADNEGSKTDARALYSILTKHVQMSFIG